MSWQRMSGGERFHPSTSVMITVVLASFVLLPFSPVCGPATGTQVIPLTTDNGSMLEGQDHAARHARVPLPHRLVFWDAEGQIFHGTSTFPATDTDSAASWELSTDHPAGASVSVTATPAAPGVLALHIAPPPGTRIIEVCLPAHHEEHFYGLGERFGRLDLAGQVVANWIADQALERGNSTSYSPMPFLLSSRGYGLLVDTSAYAMFDLRHRLHGGYCLWVITETLTLSLIAGPHPQTVLERHSALIGRPPLPPRWAFGVWKNLIGGQARVEQDVARLRAAGIPLHAVWIYDAVDEHAVVGWPWQIYQPIAPGPYPDLRGMIARLHAQGLKVLGYLNNFVYSGSAAFAAAAQHGYLIRTPHGQPYVEPWAFTPRGWVDFTNPDATAWWQARVTHVLSSVGFDGAMLDFGDAAPVQAQYASGQSGALLRNQYPTLYTRAAYLAGQAAKPHDVVFFARAGYHGSQPYTTGRFTGDQVRSWDPHKGLPSVLAGMLNGGLSGWPYWGPDIGGFFENSMVPRHESVAERAQRLEAEKEVWIRWVQLGALSPTMRDMLGGQTDPVTLWTDDETLTVFRMYARLHTALMPYLYRYAQVAHARGLPILRPLFLTYPDEAVTYALDDEYLVGDDLLVAPVLSPGLATRTLYLPPGHWCYYWTGKVHTGAGWVTVPAPRHHIPLFVRAGAALSLPTPVQLTTPPP